MIIITEEEEDRNAIKVIEPGQGWFRNNPNMTEEKEVFEKFASKHGDKITKKDLKQALKELRFDEEDLDDGLKDLSKHNLIGFSKFMMIKQELAEIEEMTLLDFGPFTGILREYQKIKF
jgi:hypothetical protein